MHYVILKMEKCSKLPLPTFNVEKCLTMST